LFKNSEALEKVHNIKEIALDKTGTITKGEPKVKKIHISENFKREVKDPNSGWFSEIETKAKNTNPQNIFLQYAASVEKNSEHPLAKAVVDHAENEKLTLLKCDNFEALPGNGVKGSVKNKKIIMGSIKLIQDLKINTDEFTQAQSELENKANTVLWLAIDNQVVGLIAIADTIKEFSLEAVRELKQLQIQVSMITGDNEFTAKEIARKVAIEKIYAQVMPEEKNIVVKNIQEKTKGFVGMVGDGINDAPALAQADVGIAMGSGTDVAIETADIALMGNDLRSITQMIRLSKATMRTIKQNLFWAFIYNIILIPIAAGVLYPIPEVPQFLRSLHPVLAALAMAFSSVSVVLNSLRLKTVKI
jgi:Cu+-exporting ATPase